MSTTEHPWPAGFIWGSATAAAQIEGAAHEDGKEDSIWDAFARIPGAVINGDTPEIAVDHYHRMPEDVAVMKELGLDSYRFSTSWARVKPGDRYVNAKGLDFYSRLVDELLGAGILPWLTLYHWDLPQALEDRGGWTNRDTAFRFADYAEAVYEALGDRVHHWTTFNEPLCSSLIAYTSGEHAPGRTDPRAGLAAVHHQHLAHGLAVTRLRELGAARSALTLAGSSADQIGITLNLTTAVPNDPSDPVDLEAARRIDGLWNRLFLEPLLLGAYPADVLQDVREYGLDELILPEDLDLISVPLDFVGVNHYHDDNVSGHPLAISTAIVDDPVEADGLETDTVDAALQEIAEIGIAMPTPTAAPTTREKRSPFVGSEYVTFPPRALPHTAMGWEVNPEGLHGLLVRLGREYPTLPPLYVTENGAAYDDVVSPDGCIHDAERTAYIESHIDAIGRAIADGADVRGYFVWSLLDNFEWAWGYEKRFGIVRVDYASQLRTVKDSGRCYARIIKESREHAYN